MTTSCHREPRDSPIDSRLGWACSFGGSRGDSYDNAAAESCFGLFKTELIRPQGPWKDLDDVEFATCEWVDWYNNRRLHTSLDYNTPAEYEQAHYATLNREPQPA